MALVGLLQAGTPPRVTVLSLIVVAATLAASLRWRIGWAAVIILLAVGIALRVAPATGFSDVLVVTEAAIREMLAGGNPYGHGFAESVPPGAPFAYGPLALLWYLPSLDRPGLMELLASLVVLGLLALRGRPLGLAIYAVTPAFVVAATDGSNDTTAGLLLLVALLAAVRWPVAGRCCWPWPTAFKPYALAWLPGLIAYAGSVGPLVAFLVATAVAWLPAVVAWGPESLLWSFRRADEIHTQPYYSLAYGLGSPESRAQGRLAGPARRRRASCWPSLSLRLVRSRGLARHRRHARLRRHPVPRLLEHLRLPGRRGPGHLLAPGRLAGTRGAARGLAGRPGACRHQLGRSTLAASPIRAIARLKRPWPTALESASPSREPQRAVRCAAGGSHVSDRIGLLIVANAADYLIVPGHGGRGTASARR